MPRRDRLGDCHPSGLRNRVENAEFDILNAIPHQCRKMWPETAIKILTITKKLHNLHGGSAILMVTYLDVSRSETAADQQDLIDSKIENFTLCPRRENGRPECQSYAIFPDRSRLTSQGGANDETPNSKHGRACVDDVRRFCAMQWICRQTPMHYLVVEPNCANVEPTWEYRWEQSESRNCARRLRRNEYRAQRRRRGRDS